MVCHTPDEPPTLRTSPVGSLVEPMTISAEASGVPEAADESPPEPEPEPQAASARAAATARAAPSGARRERRVLTGVSFREGRAAVCRAWGWACVRGVGRGAVGRGAWGGAAVPGGPEPDRWVGNSRDGAARRARGGRSGAPG